MKKVISNILSFILFALIILVCLLTIIRTTILNQDYVISKLESANYYERMSGEIVEQFKNYTIQSGLSDNVIENLYTPDGLKQDINNVINSIYTGSKLEIDTSEIGEKLKENILKEVEDEGITVDFEEESMREYIRAIEDAYESQVSYSTDVVNDIGSTFKKIQNLVEKVQMLALGMLVFIAILILYVNTKFKLRTLKYLAISIMASGAFILIIRIIIELSMDLKNIMIMNQATTNALQLVIDDILTKITIVGAALFVVGLVVSIVYNIVKKR